MNVFLVNVIVFLVIFLIECTVQRSRVALMLVRRFRNNLWYFILFSYRLNNSRKSAEDDAKQIDTISL